MLLKIEQNRLLLETRPNPAVLSAVPRLEGYRKWLKGGGLAVENTPLNLSILGALPGVVVERAENLVAGELYDRPVPAATYTPKTKPYPHQIRALAKLKDKPVLGLFMEQGTGKTKVLLDWAGELHAAGKITGALVVSKKGAHRQWIEAEIPRHYGAAFTGYFWPLKGAITDWFKGPMEGLEFFTINWDGLKTTGGQAAAQAFAARHQMRLLIIGDESQEMKNKKSQRWSAINAVKPFSNHRALATGTPIAKDLTDEWAQLSWLDESILGIRYITAFRAEYCVMGGFEGRVVVGSRNVDQFKAKTGPFIFRATKEEIGILPKQYSEWVFDLTREQKEMIKSLKQELEAVLNSGQTITAQTAAVTLVKMQQVSSGFILDENKIAHRLMPVAKNPRVIAALEYLNADDGAAIVWIRFREDAKIMAEGMKDAGISFVEYHGGTSDAARADAVSQFTAEGGHKVLLANPQSAGTGLNLQGRCRRALYYSNSFNSIDRWQSEDRIHRIGTLGAVTYTDLIAKGSIDRHITRNLMKKKGLSELVLDDIRQLVTEFDDPDLPETGTEIVTDLSPDHLKTYDEVFGYDDK
tara:strand:+ start:165 stop:1910 length:1746 start_codon:yes stop_codon:yes gene_type:complete